MEFDWLEAPFDLKALTPRAIEESFEDPFSLRLLPDYESGEARYFNLGRSAEGRAIFSVFWTDGKNPAGHRGAGYDKGRIKIILM